jgi:uncharacterized membrane protein YeaQ/YmgE (transglycosylase-associated protein family)
VSFIIWLIVGGLLGWLASSIMRTDARGGATLNVVAGLIGSALGAWFIAPLVGGAGIDRAHFTATGLMSSLLGAVILLALVRLLRRGQT